MSDLRIRDLISRWMGWCPMNGNIQGDIREGENAARDKTADSGGPFLSRSLLLQVIPRFDNQREGFEQGRDLYQVVVFATVTMLFGLEVVVLLIASGIEIAVEVVFPMMIGLLFIVIGGVLPHIRQNTTTGIRLPWTLRDEENWKKTHQRGGFLFVVGGILMMIVSPFADRWAFLLLLIVVVAITLYLTLSSFLLSKRTGDIIR